MRKQSITSTPEAAYMTPPDHTSLPLQKQHYLDFYCQISILPNFKLYINGLIHVLLCVWLLLTNLINVVAHSSLFSLLYITPLYEYTSLVMLLLLVFCSFLSLDNAMNILVHVFQYISLSLAYRYT